MQSTFLGIELGKRSLIAHTQGLATVGHNVSNANVEGYSRQRVEMKATDPLYMPHLNREETPGQIGQGVSIASIERIRDGILEGRIISQAHGEGYWQTRDKYLLMVEQVYTEPTELSVRGQLDRFWDSWQELSIHPDQMAARHSVLQRGKALIDSIHTRYKSLTQIRNMLEDDVQATVKQVNEINREITALNEQIVKIKAMGDNPNDLLDQRDKLVEELAGIIDITIDQRDPDEFTIHSGGYHIVQGMLYRPITAIPDPQNEGYSRVAWDDNGETTRFSGGKLASLLQLRDGDVRGEIQNLDNMTINFTDMVNEIHSSGYGLNKLTGRDFFVEYPFVNNTLGNYDRNGDGELDSTYIFRVTGSNSLDAQQQIGLEGTLTLSGMNGDVAVPYYSTDTVSDLISRINNSSSEVVARLDRNGRLEMKASPAQNEEFPDFVIRHMEDSGQFLTGYAGILVDSGPDGAFRWDQQDAVLALRGGDLDYAVAPLTHPSGWIEINPELFEEPAAIAAGLGYDGKAAEVGNGEAAVAIASLRNQPVMLGQTLTFDDYFADTVASIGLRGEEAEIALDTQELIMKDLRDMRESISGVNIDEEFSQLIKYQHGYSAAARFVSEFNTMLDTLINRMGV